MPKIEGFMPQCLLPIVVKKQRTVQKHTQYMILKCEKHNPKKEKTKKRKNGAMDTRRERPVCTIKTPIIMIESILRKTKRTVQKHMQYMKLKCEKHHPKIT
jgi:hypothetical protein